MWALANLGPARLTFLVIVLEAHLSKIKNEYVLEHMLFARLLLFVVFAESPHQGHASRPAAALTAHQRQSLLMLLEQDQLWHVGNSLGLLKAYGLPGSRKDMACAGYFDYRPQIPCSIVLNTCFFRPDVESSQHRGNRRSCGG